MRQEIGAGGRSAIIMDVDETNDRRIKLWNDRMRRARRNLLLLQHRYDALVILLVGIVMKELVQGRADGH